MKQRLQIARGLINDPEIIFLDEPTIGLDPIGAREIRNIIKRLKNMKKPLFLRSHYMQEVEELCDRIAFLKSEEIITIDTPASLKSKYSESFEIKLLIDKHFKAKLNELEKLKYVKNLKIHENENFLEVILVITPESIATSNIFTNLKGIPIHDLIVKKISLEDVYLKLLGE